MIYFVLFFCLLLCIYAYDYRKHNVGNMVAYIVICLFFILLAGMRYRLGIDSTTYESQYKGFPALSELGSYNYENTRYEPGFIMFVGITRAISPDFTYFQILHAIVVNTIIFWFIYKNTQNKFIGVTLYYLGLYLTLNMEVLREALAVCCFLLGWPYFKNGKWLKYYIFALLACFFHISAIVTLVFPLFTLPGIREGFKIGWRTVFICIAVFAISYFLQRKVFALIIASGVSQSISEKAALYSKSSFGGMNLNIVGMLDVIIRVILFPALAIWFLRLKVRAKENLEEIKQFQKLETLIATGIYFSTITMVIFIFTRFNNYLGLFNYIAIASCFFTKLDLRRRPIRIPGGYWAAIFFIIFILYFKGYFGPTYGSKTRKIYQIYYPYYSRLNPQDDPDREMIFRFVKRL